MKESWLDENLSVRTTVVRLVPAALKPTFERVETTLTHQALVPFEHPNMRMVMCLRAWLSDGYEPTDDQIVTCLVCLASPHPSPG